MRSSLAASGRMMLEGRCMQMGQPQCSCTFSRYRSLAHLEDVYPSKASGGGGNRDVETSPNSDRPEYVQVPPVDMKCIGMRRGIIISTSSLVACKLAARSGDKAKKVIEDIKSKNPNSTGDVIYLHLDLEDLITIKKSAEEFLSLERRLDVLWNNAGVMMSPKGSKTKQDYEKQLGANALGPFLFTQQLMGILSSTAKGVPEASVRVVWLSSSMVQLLAPPGGVDLDNLDYKTEKGAMHKYAVSKATNTFYSTEIARRHGEDGIVSVSLDPGNLRTDLPREASPWFRRIWNLALNPASTVHIPSYSRGSAADTARERSDKEIVALENGNQRQQGAGPTDA